MKNHNTKTTAFRKQSTPILLILLGFIIFLFCSVNKGFEVYGFVSIPFIISGAIWLDKNEEHNEWKFSRLIRKLELLEKAFKELDCNTQDEFRICKKRIGEQENRKCQTVKCQVVASDEWIEKQKEAKQDE